MSNKNTLGLSLENTGLGKDELFDKLYWEKAAQIKKQAFYLVGPNFFEDAVQEVFIKIYKNLLNFKNQSSVDTWIYRITVNTCFDFLRKSKKNKKLKESFNNYPKLGITLEGDSESREAIIKAVDLLDKKHRSVFVLHYISGLKISEISEVLEIKEGTVKSRLFNSKNDVKSYLTKEGVYNG